MSTGQNTPIEVGFNAEGRCALERRALESVVASEAFDRSRSLCRILNYLCAKHFDGQTQEIKEYNIAVEALGRPVDFDQKKDAIVRVEMHRLRKRLREYYDGPGAADPIRIIFAEKGYVPQFVLGEQVPPGRDGQNGDDPSAIAAIEVPKPEGPSAVPLSLVAVSRYRWDSRLIWLAAALALCGSVVAIALTRRNGADKTKSGTVAIVGNAERSHVPVWEEPEIRIVAGRAPGRYSDRDGRFWEGDRFFQGGEAVAINGAEVVTRGFERNLFGAMREGRFEYAVPLKPGYYEMEVIFAETSYGEGNPLGGGEGVRPFTIRANGKDLSEVDVLADAGGPNIAISRLFSGLSPAADGYLHVGFDAAPARKAFVNAIRISRSPSAKLNPIRIVAMPQAYRDPSGNWWQPDTYYQGGIQISRPTLPWGDEGFLYQGERYGNFTYSIPVPPGKYSATIYFSEYWFGKGRPGAGGQGSRSFDVYCNFKPLLTNFDVLKQGTAQQTVKKTFRGLEPNPQGRLVFAFVARVNHAMLSAIEIEQE